MRRRWWLVGPAMGGIVGAGLWAASQCDGVCDGVCDGGPGDVDARATSYAARIGLPLPEGTRAEFAEWMAGIDNAARLGLVMPEAGWASIRDRLPEQPFDTAGNALFGPEVPGWMPGRTPGLVSVHVPWGGGRQAMLMGVAPAGPGEVRVFVFWNEL